MSDLRLFSIPPGVAFLPELAAALCEGRLVPDFAADAADPLALSEVTIYVPTRRAARELRAVFLRRSAAPSAILPLIRPLGEFDEDAALFDAEPSAAIDLSPPIGALDRLLALAPLVHAWKSRLPAHLAQRFGEEVVVPTSAADAIWLARDLCDLMDEVETEGADWSKLEMLGGADLAEWWQVTLEFLSIVTKHWPDLLSERSRSGPAAHRNALISAEAARLTRIPTAGPVIAAGSTGSIPATARLLKAIAHLPKGAVILPGLDLGLDEDAWSLIGAPDQAPSVFGHPQYGLKKLLGIIGAARGDVAILGQPAPALAARTALVSEALRPAETTDRWTETRALTARGALDGVTLVEAANERDEAAAIAIALRRATDGDPGRSAALVTGDRDLARRVSAELLRFGIRADDSGGAPLEATPPAILFRLVVETVFSPGDPLAILALLKHPLLRLGQPRAVMRQAAETIELVALRGGASRPDAAGMADEFDARLTGIGARAWSPFWLGRMGAPRFDAARAMLAALDAALAPLAALRGGDAVSIDALVRASVLAFEACGRGEEGDVADLYARDAGGKLAEFLRELASIGAAGRLVPREWPDALAALIAGVTVKPAAGSDSRVAIWGALEARLQSVDTLILGGLNEGAWPRKVQPGRFMSRLMKAELNLDPPERRIGLAAHDFWMALGAPEVILTRAARSGDAPSSASRWLQRLLTFAGGEAVGAMRGRGAELLDWARALDAGERVPTAQRPQPTPPLDARPRHFSVTDIETLRRDPYAIYARKVLGLVALDPLVRDPGAADRGQLVHEILHAFSEAVGDPGRADAAALLTGIARKLFDAAALPVDVEAVWWPRFTKLVDGIVVWERKRAGISRRLSEAVATPHEIGATGVTLGGRADRIDLRPAGMADILDYKTGSRPSIRQAHMLLSPQLALEAALLGRGAFEAAGKAMPAELAYVRLKPDGAVKEESILDVKGSLRSAPDLAEDAWARLTALIETYGNEVRGYVSRALPFQEGDYDGDYDHLARVLEWSAGADADADGEGAE